MNMEPSAFLVCEKGLDAESLFIQATGLLCCGHIADQIQRLLIPLGPTTQHHDGTISISCDMDFLSLDQPAWLETRPQGIEAKRLAVPHRPPSNSRVANRG